jgi:N-methylhydantoinase B
MSTFAIPGSERFESTAKLAAELQVDPSLPLYEVPAGLEVSPVTYAVVSHKLTQINDEAAVTIRKVSGSPVVNEAADFNTALGDPRGDLFALGDYISVHGTVVQRLIQWTLEHRSANPGIRDGDAFLVNDPWVGAAHQNDTALLRPVFVDGELFAWVGATLHFLDLGGRYPSSLIPDAQDIFVESVPMPPVKLVEDGVMRADIEDMFLRRSRLPLSAALDLRALLAATTVAANRIQELVDSYGADVVAQVIQQILDSTEAQFRARLTELPDGTWRHLHLWDSAGAGDRGLYKLPVTLHKQGDRLIFDLQEVDPQTGAINCARTLSESGIVAAILPLLCPDLPWAPGAVLRAVEFRFGRGTILAAEFPASTGGGTTQAAWSTVNSATVLISKMLAACPAYKENLLAVSTPGWVFQLIGGINKTGFPTLALSLDQAAGGIGARSWADGDDTAGMMLSPSCQIANVETQEWYEPLLWLYRAELPDSGGPGRFRGGNGGRSAVMPYDTPMDLFNICYSSGMAVASGAGLCGGWPARAGYYKLARDTAVWDRYRSGNQAVDEDDLGVTVEWPPGQGGMLPIGLTDVFATGWLGGGGYGDPLERDLDAIEQDIIEERTSPEHAANVYGAVTDGARVDRERSRIRREELRGARLGSGPVPAPRPARLPEGGRWLDENIVLRQAGHACCARCDHELALPGQNYKLGCRVIETPVAETDRVWVDPSTYVDDADIVFRQFACPGCGTLLETEVTLRGLPPIHDKQLA